MTRLAPLAACLLLAGTTSAADLTKVERKIDKEPAYRTKLQRYALVVFGPEARDRVWLVQDGDELHVLGDQAVKVPPKKDSASDEGNNYTLDELTVGGKTHRNLRVRIDPLRRWMFDEFAKRPDMTAALKKDPDARSLLVSLDVVAPHLKPKGTVQMLAGPIDLSGPLVLAPKAMEAPIIHVAGPLEITFYTGRPRLKRERTADVITAVGTPGLGAGTFAMVGYDDTIPEASHPRMAVTFPPSKEGEGPVKQLYELKKRC